MMLTMETAHWPPRCEPANSQYERPVALGRPEPPQLLLIGASPVIEFSISRMTSLTKRRPNSNAAPSRALGVESGQPRKFSYFQLSIMVCFHYLTLCNAPKFCGHELFSTSQLSIRTGHRIVGNLTL